MSEKWGFVFFLLWVPLPNAFTQDTSNKPSQFLIEFGSCRFVINGQCPDPLVTFFMYSTSNPENPEQIQIGNTLRTSNLHKTAFDPKKSTKFIIHGYNSDMLLNALKELRKEYLKNDDVNVFTVDWSPLNQAPCYPAAVWNAQHVGQCSAQLIKRLRDMGAEDLHVIGFSLGAQITNYLSLALRPYYLPRITGLDPAFPGYVTGNIDAKLDKSDAKFVDVYHTNAFIQGKAEESGHVDFYFNGGSVQPGCALDLQFFSCNHHRAPLYYAESINSNVGFWGWSCPSYMDYLFGRCPPDELEVRLGHFVDTSLKGVYMVVTNSAPPFAIGNGLPSHENLVKENERNRMELLRLYKKDVLDIIDLEEKEEFEEVYKHGALQNAISHRVVDDFVLFSQNETDIVDIF